MEDDDRAGPAAKEAQVSGTWDPPRKADERKRDGASRNKFGVSVTDEYVRKIIFNRDRL